MEHDPTAIDPNEVHEFPEEEQVPPEGYEPQTKLAPNQTGGITERQPDLIEETEAEEPDHQSEGDGVADDGDDGDDN